MKKSSFIILAFASLIPLQVWALGFEAAVGLGRQEPEGTFGYNTVVSSDKIDLKDDADLDTEQRVYGRLKLDMPLLIPNIYLMATPMDFSGIGQKPLSFKFGDETFDANSTFEFDVRLDQYDVALYYGIPLMETATLKTFNVDVGLNLKYIDYRGAVTGTVSGQMMKESDSQQIPIPTLFLGAQLRPMDWLSLEAEGRGIAYGDNSLMDLIGRVKIKPSLSPVFVAGGWRYESLRLDEFDIKADIDISGPFVEAGVQF